MTCSARAELAAVNQNLIELRKGKTHVLPIWISMWSEGYTQLQITLAFLWRGQKLKSMCEVHSPVMTQTHLKMAPSRETIEHFLSTTEGLITAVP